MSDDLIARADAWLAAGPATLESDGYLALIRDLAAALRKAEAERDEAWRAVTRYESAFLDSGPSYHFVKLHFGSRSLAAAAMDALNDERDRIYALLSEREGER